MGLATAQDQSAVVLVGDCCSPEAETDFSLVRIDNSGREIVRKSLALPVYGQETITAICAWTAPPALPPSIATGGRVGARRP